MFLLIIIIILTISPPSILKAQVTAEDITWDFECGSLESASSAIPNDINLILRLDDQSGDLYGWYYFKIVRNAANQTVTFHILNPDNWTNENHKPVYSYDGALWFRLQNTWMASGDFHFSQYFTIDSVQIAFVFPYSYSDLLDDLDYLSISPHFEYESIGQSVNGRDIPLVTISDSQYPDDEKRTCWIISRQHPMETPPSFTIQALMECLAGLGIPNREGMLRYLIFKVVPMVNVDGVAEGLSRHNVNGVNLNRCWCSDSTYAGEEPEVEAVHRAIDEWIASGNSVDFFIDMHAAPDLYDFGFQLSQGYSYESYYDDITSFLKHLDGNSPFQDWTLWRDLDENYGTGLSILALYDQHGIPLASSEHSWTRRGNGLYITIPGLLSEGQMYLQSFYDYLHPIDFTDYLGFPFDTVSIGDEIYFTIDDPDEDENSYAIESILLTIHSEPTGDIESLLLLETTFNSGVFRNPIGLPLLNEIPQPYNGQLEAEPGDRITAVYQDDDFHLDSSWTYAAVSSSSNINFSDTNTLSIFKISSYPNPANNKVNIDFIIPYRTDIFLKVYNPLGRQSHNTIILQCPPGLNSIPLNFTGYSSGVYFAEISTGNGLSAIVKIVVEK
ncbi:MAG: T9SS type A sorting domain-containing protein [candidate division Zixibacteria bacterium]|nr:T9SS type A sorting domain-containing protein [Candidatus Tariuqbacter arcticus]